jgi:hypothetical protein
VPSEGQGAHDGQAQPGGGPPQQRRPGIGGQTPPLEGGEVAIRGAQLIAAQPRVEPVGQGLLPDRPRPDLRGQERVRAALGQGHHPRLRKRRTVCPRPRVAELGGVALSVGHLDLETVDRHHPPPPQPRPPRRHVRHRAHNLLEHLRQHLRAQPFTGLGDPTRGRHRPPRIPAAPRRQRPRDLGRDLLIVVLSEQTQPHRQIRRHVRRELPTRAPVSDPAHRHRAVHRIPRHRRDQHPQRHLIRPHHHTLNHDHRPCHPTRSTSRRHAEQTKEQQDNTMIKISYVALGPGCPSRSLGSPEAPSWVVTGGAGRSRANRLGRGTV